MQPYQATLTLQKCRCTSTSGITRRALARYWFLQWKMNAWYLKYEQEVLFFFATKLYNSIVLKIACLYFQPISDGSSLAAELLFSNVTVACDDTSYLVTSVFCSEPSTGIHVHFISLNLLLSANIRVGAGLTSIHFVHCFKVFLRADEGLH